MFVSTDKGAIYCFAAGLRGAAVTQDRQVKPYGDNTAAASAAKAILKKNRRAGRLLRGSGLRRWSLGIRIGEAVEADDLRG